MNFALAVGLVLSWATVAFIGWLLYLTVRQQGRVLIAHEEIRTRLANAEAVIQRLAERPAVVIPPPAPAPQAATAPAPPPALGLGSQAPDFRLPDLKGRFRTLADYRGKPAVLVFFNPDCGFCTQLAPKLGELPMSAPQLVVMTRGDKQVNRQLARTHHWKGDVLLEPNWDVASTYRTNATPTGYLIDSEGRIASTLAVGVDGVLTLTKMLNGTGNGHDHVADLTTDALSHKQEAAVEKAKAAGLAITDSKLQRNGLPAGTEAPNFTLPDLNGKPWTLADFRGKRVLLVFSDPGCGPCQTVAPSLEQLHEAHRDNRLTVLMISKGDLEANRQKAREHGFTFPVVMQRNWEISKEYAMFATPVGYLIDERGVISKEVAIGGDAILRLVSER